MKKLIFISLILFTSKLFAATNFPEIEGWKKSETIKTYDSETLWEYINGAAEYYLAYEFSQLEWVEYSISEDVYIKAEVYHHSSPINAFGIYAYERSSDSEFLTIGNEGYMAHSALNFYIGNCYIKIYSHNNTESTISAIKSIANKLSDNIDDSPTKPEELNALPQQNLSAHTEKYKPENYLGYSFLKNVINAKYQLNDEEVEFFSIVHSTDEEALNNFQQYLDFLKSDIKPEVNNIYELDDLFNGKLFILVTDQKILGVLNASSLKTAKSLLDKSQKP